MHTHILKHTHAYGGAFQVPHTTVCETPLPIGVRGFPDSPGRGAAAGRGQCAAAAGPGLQLTGGGKGGGLGVPWVCPARRHHAWGRTPIACCQLKVCSAGDVLVERVSGVSGVWDLPGFGCQKIKLAPQMWLLIRNQKQRLSPRRSSRGGGGCLPGRVMSETLPPKRPLSGFPTPSMPGFCQASCLSTVSGHAPLGGVGSGCLGPPLTPPPGSGRPCLKTQPGRYCSVSRRNVAHRGWRGNTPRTRLGGGPQNCVQFFWVVLDVDPGSMPGSVLHT